VYSSSGTVRFYNHFVWQAMAFLDGRVAIDFPVPASPDSPGNAWMQDILPVRDANGQLTGQGLIPFPPLPAIVLLPFVAVFGLATDQRLIAVVLGGINVGLVWWMLGRLAIELRVQFLVTVLFGFGTVHWYAAQLGTTWFLAHVVSLTPLLAAIGLALDQDPESAVDEPAEDVAGRSWIAALEVLRRPWEVLDRRQVFVGLLFGLACTARLPIAFGAPFFVLVGSGGTWVRRAASAGLGAVLPVGLLILYNLASTGQVFHPGYEYQYQLEAQGYPSLNYNPEWSIEDLRYVPQNIVIALFSMPAILPDVVPASVGAQRALCVEPGAVRGLFDPSCPIALPRDVGMSLLLTSPALVLAIPALRGYARSRLVTGSVLAILMIGLLNLMHFSQGWVQFGYRFSNDFVAFALILVALGAAGLRGRWRSAAVALVVASIAINLWGTWWGMKLGW
jgi:hypothetical protein